MSRKGKINKLFLSSVLVLIGIGSLIFYSASLSLIARNRDLDSVLITQGLGLLVGILAMYFLTKVPIFWFKKYHWILMAIAIGINLLILVPGLGLEHGGAKRWIDLGFITFQPSEILKFAYIISLASLLHTRTLETFKKVLWNYGLPSLIAIILMIIQSDMDTLAVILFTGLVILFVSGAKWKHLIGVILIGLVFASIVIAYKPYIINRLATYLDPDKVDMTGGGYQIRQSLIAIGSGGFAGRGLGQSIQKFNYLPEPMGDSIFAVWAEEFGFIGTFILLLTYLLFAIFGLRIASRTSDNFSRLVIVGLVILVVIESFMNISAMLGLIPLSGMPLLFVSHGGTALAMVIAEMGLILNISRGLK